MFAVSHWQLDQNSCLPNDAVLCCTAALPAAAGTPCPGSLGAAGLGSAGVLLPVVALGWMGGVVWCWWQPGPCQGCAAGAGGTGGSLHGAQPLSSPGLQQSLAVPLQSLQHSLHGAGGEEKTSPSQNCKGKREPEPLEPEP